MKRLNKITSAEGDDSKLVIAIDDLKDDFDLSLNFLLISFNFGFIIDAEKIFLKVAFGSL